MSSSVLAHYDITLPNKVAADASAYDCNANTCIQLEVQYNPSQY